ncbi:MAG: hypothetical protein QNK23_03920 [Crocinitomicaceae bacterium]|nr:hypothetical protein [Crocinitomicaceae bacterium]
MSEESQETQKKGNGAFVAIIILLFLMLGTMGYLWSSKNTQLSDCQLKNDELNADMQGMNEMMSEYVGTMSNDMKTDFRSMLSTYDELLAQDQTKADSLNAQKDRISELLAEVEQGKMSAYELFKARKEIETMKSIMRGYIVQIDSLNTLNLLLTDSLDYTTGVLQVTQEDRDRLEQETSDLNAQVAEGSKLQAYNFVSEGLKMKLNNTTTATTRAKNVVQIKASFTISANPITEAGNKPVYMQIITPEGKTLQSSSSNIIDVDGGSVAFSDQKIINYQNERVDIAIYYNLNGATLSKGNYKIKIYCQGSLVGTDSFTLK